MLLDAEIRTSLRFVPVDLPSRRVGEIARFDQPMCYDSLFWRLSCTIRQGSFQKVSEYDQEIPQSHTADQPTAPWGRATDYL